MQKKSLGLVIITTCIFSFGYADTSPQSSASNQSLPSSYMQVDIHESFQSIYQRMSAAKQAVNKKQ